MMTRDAQHKQWKRDNVRQECKELLSSLGAVFLATTQWNRDMEEARAPNVNADPAIRQLYYDAASEFYLQSSGASSDRKEDSG